MKRFTLLLALLAAPALGAAIAGLAGPSALPATPGLGAPGADVFTVTHTLTLEGARRALDAALDKARERNAGGAIAVVDQGGHLVAAVRLDGTFPAASAVSLEKARTAALFRKPTRAFEDALNGGRTALAAVREMTPLQGGIPIMHDGFVIGAVGVSGAHSQAEDEEIALAGAAAVSSIASHQ